MFVSWAMTAMVFLGGGGGETGPRGVRVRGNLRTRKAETVPGLEGLGLCGLGIIGFSICSLPLN